MDQGRRLFSEVLTSEQALLNFHGKLIGCLWPRRDPSLKLHYWFNDLVEQVIEPFADECVALHDELGTLAAFMARVAPDGDCADMVLAILAGDGSHLNRLTLSSLHSAKGREFGLVFIFGLDSPYFPHLKSNASGIQESRRLFYVGFTRAKSEIHLVHTFNGASAFVDQIRMHLEQA
jgi:DNA helicase-2/ATP-dependent DNA helicase PcrA